MNGCDVQKQPPPLPVVDEATIRARAAAARAYALSSSPDFTTPSPLRPPQVPAVERAHTQQQPPHQQQQQQQPQQPHQQQQQHQIFVPHIQDEDYALFVKSLVDDEFFQSLPVDDEDFDFDFDVNLSAEEDDDDDDDDDEDDEEELDQDEHDQDANDSTANETNRKLPAATSKSQSQDDDDDDDEPFTLQAELGLLLEEDIEAAITTLLSTSSAQHPPPTPEKTSTSHTFNSLNSSSTATDDVPRTPLHRDGTTSSSTSTAPTKTTVTALQVARLKTMLQKHYQLLVQQAVLCVRAAQAPVHRTHVSESKEDLVEILDGAVGLLQDLDQNRKDAIRTSIQLENNNNNNSNVMTSAPSGEGRLTRAAFTRTLQTSQGQTIFDIRGLSRLKHTFATLDEATPDRTASHSSSTTTTNSQSNGTTATTTCVYDACKALLEDAAGTDYEKGLLPDAPDKEYSEVLSQPKEFFGPDFRPPCSKEQITMLKRDRNQFTAAEDSLVFRGVNLYGEKQWLLIADRYLPDRSINIISQRYSKLSLMLYQAHGIKIDAEGDLDVPPIAESGPRPLSVEKALAALKKVDPPAILNVHRWSIEEDLTLLRAVPLLGHMWAEVSTRFIPHRDRGHLRKRYQVLERRVKATVLRAQKEQPRHVVSKEVPVPEPSMSYAVTVKASPPSRAPQFLKKRGMVDVYDTLKASPIKVPPGKPGHVLPTSPQNAYEENSHFDDPDSSRIGFERILQENDWSQMSRVKHIMDHEPPNSSLSGVNHLASAAAAAAAMERMDREDHSNQSSGLAMLAENVLDDSMPSPPKKTRRSILDSVMERTKNTRHFDSHHHQQQQYHHDTPSRRSPRKSAANTTSLTPLSSPAPRIGYSPASHYKSGMSPLPAFHKSSPPGMIGGGNSAVASALWGSDSLQCETDAMDPAYAFNISERSQQMLGTIGTPSRLPDITGTGLTPSGCHMLGTSNSGFGGHEMDVVKALNELSNSPARFDKKEERKNGDEAKPIDRVKRSLFDNVVNGADRKKRKH